MSVRPTVVRQWPSSFSPQEYVEPKKRTHVTRVRCKASRMGKGLSAQVLPQFRHMLHIDVNRQGRPVFEDGVHRESASSLERPRSEARNPGHHAHETLREEMSNVEKNGQCMKHLRTAQGLCLRNRDRWGGQKTTSKQIHGAGELEPWTVVIWLKWEEFYRETSLNNSKTS